MITLLEYSEPFIVETRMYLDDQQRLIKWDLSISYGLAELEQLISVVKEEIVRQLATSSNSDPQLHYEFIHVIDNNDNTFYIAVDHNSYTVYDREPALMLVYQLKG